jgi:hypothetical protein
MRLDQPGSRRLRPAQPGNQGFEREKRARDGQLRYRRLVCEQWNGQRWVVIPVAAKQCQP